VTGCDNEDNVEEVEINADKCNPYLRRIVEGTALAADEHYQASVMNRKLNF
jgi:hypothetical protein